MDKRSVIRQKLEAVLGRTSNAELKELVYKYFDFTKKSLQKCESIVKLLED